MRAIPISQIKEGQILGQTLYLENGQVLLKKGAHITDFMIKKLKESGYSSIYIWKDGLDYNIEDVVKPEVRQKTINDLRKFVVNAATSSKSSSNTKIKNKKMEENIHVLKAGATDIVDELFTKKNIVVELLDLKNINNGLYQHSVNVMIHSVIMGVSVGLNKIELSKLALAAVLHDFGIVFMPTEIINKKGKLTSKEYRIVQEHSKKGFDFLRDKLNLESTIRIAVLEHHEKYDGSGYPDGKKADETHLYSRIISIANKFDALTSDRIYRKASPVGEALEFIMGGGGTYFDPELTKTFIKHINPYPINTLIKLNTEDIGAVIKVNDNIFTRPVVKIIAGKNKGEEINLLETKNIVILTTIK